MRILISSLVAALALAQQSQVLFPGPKDAPVQQYEIPQPNKQELDAADVRAVLEAQRKQGFAWSEANRLRAEWREAEKRAEGADRELLDVLGRMKRKYQCESCDLNWQMKWEAPLGLKFTEAKKTRKPEKP